MIIAMLSGSDSNLNIPIARLRRFYQKRRHFFYVWEFLIHLSEN